MAQGLLKLYERWDGKGLTGVRGEDIPVVSRAIAVASFAEVFYTALGERVVLDGLREQEGLAHDPACSHPLRELITERAPWAAFDSATFWADLLALEPAGSRRIVNEDRVDEVAEAFADFTDFKSPYYLGHSRGVARLAEEAARRMGLPDADVRALRTAGLLHDLGRVSVSNVVLDKAGPPSVGEWERVRLHPYYTQRILEQTPRLAPLGGLAGAHHERLDGSGYYRGARAPQLPIASRVLAAADVCQALVEDRPHRHGRSREAAAAVLRQEATAGRLDGECVEATIEALSGTPRRRARAVTDLSPRELEVLRLLARGRSNREIASDLAISERTAHHHVEHVYEKLGVSTRAGAVMQAIARGLAEEVIAGAGS